MKLHQIKSTGSSTTIASLTRKLSLSAVLAACLSSPAWGEVKTTIVGNPIINEDRVTLRIRVQDELSKPLMGLQDLDFKLFVDGEEVAFHPRDWKSATETTPPPAWVVILLDYTGSMNSLDSSGVTRLEGAISATREFIKRSEERAGTTMISIVPFGEPGGACDGFPVNNETLDRFLPAGDFKLYNYLDNLATQTPCASTNLYQPIMSAVSFLANTEDPRFATPESAREPEPRLSVILLSDGYHNKGDEEQEFKRLSNLLRRNDNIVVHTLGYGLTPAQLGQKYNLGREVTRQDLGDAKGKVPFEEFVDKQRLAEIAQITGGIAEFSGNASATVEALQLFLNSLLGEYEITFSEPRHERGSRHLVSVQAKFPGMNDLIASEEKPYIITVFGRSIPFELRITTFISSLVLLVIGGIVPFRYWGEYLKKQALDD